MANKEKVKSIIKALMQQLYEAKGFDNLNCNSLERNIFEAEMKELWEDVEAHVTLYTDEREEYEEEIEDLKDQIEALKERNEMLENDNTDLIDTNYDLKEENDKLKEILHNVSEAVNVTWN
jgi:predicted nuclease with TOPRIM domain